MSVAIFRVTVRGRFDGLDDSTRMQLIDSADEHDALLARFTPTGTLTYDKRVDFFSYRVETRVQHDDESESVVRALAFGQAERIARRDLESRHAGCRAISVSGSNMASIWERERH